MFSRQIYTDGCYMAFRSHRVSSAQPGAFPASLRAPWPGDGEVTARAELNLDTAEVCVRVCLQYIRIFLHFLLSLSLWVICGWEEGREERTSEGNEWESKGWRRRRDHTESWEAEDPLQIEMYRFPCRKWIGRGGKTSITLLEWLTKRIHSVQMYSHWNEIKLPADVSK